jgi:hypothetical protein
MSSLSLGGWRRCCANFIGVPLCLVIAASAQQGRRVPPLAFQISGTVVDAVSGQALAGAEVLTGPAEGDAAGQRTSTAEDGRFVFSGVKPGKYWLRAQRSGYALQNLDEHEDFSTAVAVGPHLNSDDLVFRLRPGASLTGTITDEAGDPIRDAQILLFRDSVAGGQRAVRQLSASGVDDRGLYHFGKLMPGTYFVAVMAHPWYAKNGILQPRSTGTDSSDFIPAEHSPLDVAYPLTFYPGVSDENAAAPIELKSGDRGAADIVLSAVPSVHLMVRGAGDPAQPVSAEIVRHAFNSQAIPVGGITATAGHDVEISAAAQPGVEVRVEHGGASPGGWSRAVNVMSDVEISAQNSSPPIRGTVSLDGAVPPAGMFLQLVDRSSGVLLNTQTGSNGAFEFDATPPDPGTYEVLISDNGSAIVRSVSAEGAKANGRTVHLTGAGTVKLKVDATSKLGRVEGIALRNGKPAPGAMIVLLPHDPTDATLFRRDQSDSDGTFTLHDVLPGSYSVIALSDWEAEWLNPSALKPLLPQARTVEVTTGRPPHVEVKVQ